MDTDNPMKQSKLWSNRCTAVGGTKNDKNFCKSHNWCKFYFWFDERMVWVFEDHCHSSECCSICHHLQSQWLPDKKRIN